jgi:hypothetical protein
MATSTGRAVRQTSIRGFAIPPSLIRLSRFSCVGQQQIRSRRAPRQRYATIACSAPDRRGADRAAAHHPVTARPSANPCLSERTRPSRRPVAIDLVAFDFLRNSRTNPAKRSAETTALPARPHPAPRSVMRERDVTFRAHREATSVTMRPLIGWPANQATSASPRSRTAPGDQSTAGLTEAKSPRLWNSLHMLPLSSRSACPQPCFYSGVFNF